MKVLLSIASLGFAGGERQIVTLVNHLDRRRFSPMLLFPNIGTPIDRIRDDVPIYDLKRRYRYRDFPLILLRAARVLRKEKPNVMLAVEPYAATLLVLAKALSRIPVKVIIREGCAWKQYEDDHISNWFRRWIYPKADLLIANSQGTKDDLVCHFPIPREKVRVIYNMVDVERVRELAQEKADLSFHQDRVPLIGAMARFDKHKGIAYLIKAFAIVRRKIATQLMVIGHGKARQTLEEMAKELGVGKELVFLGHQTNPFAYIKHATVFVHPALYEGFGQTFVEAMALGVPVVATACQHGPSEVIKDRVNGLLVPPAEEKALAEAILWILRDDNLRMNLALEGQKRAEAFSVDNGIKLYEDVLSHF